MVIPFIPLSVRLNVSTKRVSVWMYPNTGKLRRASKHLLMLRAAFVVPWVLSIDVQVAKMALPRSCVRLMAALSV